MVRPALAVLSHVNARSAHPAMSSGDSDPSPTSDSDSFLTADANASPTADSHSSTDADRQARDLERLGDEIAELAAHLHAAVYRLLVLIREFDAREGWHSGFRTCAHWLSWRTGVDLGAAREKVRVARALEDLPQLSEGMRSGVLSYSKVRALTRVATAENEEELMGFALHGTASHVETLVRTWRRVDRLEERNEERERHRSRFLTVRPDLDGMYVVRGRLDPEVGALLQKAIEAAQEALYRRAGEDEETTAQQRRADAIGLLAESALQLGLLADGRHADGRYADGRHADRPDAAIVSRADRFQVVLHVDAEALRDSKTVGNGSVAYESELEDGVRVSAETSRRLACDSSRVVMTHAAAGAVLDVGRKTRTVPPSIRRALDRRDRGCRFPGCGLRFCDAHHVEHWADGGETRLENLVLLCRVHHRAVHEDGFMVAFTRDGRVQFRRPDGRLLADAPQASPLTGNPFAGLSRANGTSNLEIGAWTSTALWHGESFDLALAVRSFRNL